MHRHLPPRNLLHIIDSSIPGGGPRTLLACARGLKAHGWSSATICGDDGPLAYDLGEIGVAATALPIATKRRFLLAVPQLVWRLSRQRPAAVILYGPVAGCLGGLAARLARVSAVIYHAGWPSYYADYDLLRRARNAVVERIACGCATALWCVSRGDRELYARRGAARRKLHVIPVAVAQELLVQLERMGTGTLDDGQSVAHPVPVSVEQMRTALGLRAAHEAVVYVGRLIWWKGVDVLLRAFVQVVRARPNAHLVIVGDGPERARLEQLAGELGIAAHVVFVGYQRDVTPYYLLADVIAIPSLQEPGGAVAMEAMAAGCPIVATRVHGCADSVCDGVTGRLVPPGDAAALAEGLLWTLQESERRLALGARGRARALRHFTEEHLAARVDRLLQTASTQDGSGDDEGWCGCDD
jgi:glycosyltransferase involved in cell wall biosynthesis